MSSTWDGTFSDVAAENYERFFVPTIATAASEPLLAVAALEPGEHVLDVACGTGLVARRAAAQVGANGTVAGIDLSPDMIAVATATTTTTAGGPPGIEWHVGDATSLPFDDATFDVTLCQMGLMFVADPVAALREMARVTRPAGRVVVSAPGRIQPVFQRMQEALVEQISPDLGVFVGAVFSLHDPDALATMLRQAGWDSPSMSEPTVTVTLPPPAPFLWQYVHLTPMAPHVERAGAARQAACEHQFVAATQPLLRDGALHVDQPMVIAAATRT